jgi:hypothetical protein
MSIQKRFAGAAVAAWALTVGVGTASAQLGGGGGKKGEPPAAADHPGAVVEYKDESKGSLVVKDFAVESDGTLTYTETSAGVATTWTGRLESEEVDGLAAEAQALLTKAVFFPPSAKTPRTTLFLDTAGRSAAVDATVADLDVVALDGWLLDLAAMARAGDLDDANQLIEGKLQRADLGGRSATLLVVTRDFFELDYQIDAHGRRAETGRAALDAASTQIALDVLAVADPAGHPSVLPHETKAQAKYVLRFWDVDDPTKRRDVHPLTEYLPGLPAVEILIYMLGE